MADSSPSTADIRSEIAREISLVHQQAYGAGVYNVQVEVFADSVCIVMDIELAANERTLIAADSGDSVKVTREAFQDAIRPTFVAIIERATGRSVSGFASRTVLDMNPWSTEIFRLHPV